jgi:hypothetical protein
MPNHLQRLRSSGLFFGFGTLAVFMVANVSGHLGKEELALEAD